MDIILLFLHVFLQILCASGQMCVNESPIPPVVPPTTWTAWFSVDDPTDGVDDETLASVRKLYPSVCRSPALAECRVRFLHGELVDAGQTFAIDCTPTAGLLCQTSDQFDQEACLDYEIRFECPSSLDALPNPHFYWDLSTRQSVDDDEPLTCDGDVRSIYPNIGGMTGTVRHGLLEATESFDSSDHLCALRRSEPQTLGTVDYGSATGKCIADPACCTSGWSIAFWMRYMSIPSTLTRFIFSTGGQTSAARGVSISLSRKFSLIVRGDSSGKSWIMNMTDASTFPPDEWTHHCFTYNLEQGTKYYKNGDLLHSLLLPTLESPSTVDLDHVSMFSENSDAGSEYTPDGVFSDFKMFYRTFNETEVQKLYLKETSESSLVIYYVRKYSHDDSFDVELECLAKSGSPPTVTWYRSDDGAHFYSVSPSSDVAIYESLPNNYRRRSVLMVRGLNFLTDAIFVCEASDIVKGGSVSKFVTILKRDMYWTPWLSSDEPSDGDDREMLTDHQQAFDLLCDTPTDIQCRTVYEDIPSNESRQIFDINCKASSGLVCVDGDQNNMGSDSCYDYKVRYSCPEPTFRWTTWYDTNDPNGSMEDETYITHASQSYTDLCSQPIGAECRVKGTSEDLIASGIVAEVPYLCNANGFRCQDAENTKPCPDVEVRYRCPSSPGANLRINSLQKVGDQIESALKLECNASIEAPAVSDLEWAWFESHRSPLAVMPLAESGLATISSYTTGQCCQVSVVEIEDFYNSLLANKTVVCIARDGIIVDYKKFQADLTSFNGEVTVSSESDVIIGDTVRIDCYVSGEGVFTLDWYHTANDQTTTIIVEKGRYQAVKEMLSPTSISMSLEIVSFGDNDNGLYICSVNKGIGTDAVHLYGETRNNTPEPVVAAVSTSTVGGDVRTDGATPSDLEPQGASTPVKITAEDSPRTTAQLSTTETPQSTHEVSRPPKRVGTKRPSTEVTPPQTTLKHMSSDLSPNKGHVTTAKISVEERVETEQPSTGVTSLPTTLEPMASDAPIEGRVTTAENSVSKMRLIDGTRAVPTDNYIWLVPFIICTGIIVISVSVIGFYVKKKCNSVQPMRPVRSELRELHDEIHGLDYRQSNQIKAEIHQAATPVANEGI